VSTEADKRAIRTVADTWWAATKAGDTATVLGLMADDVEFLVPGKQPFGRAEFAEMSKGMAGFKIDGSYEIKEIYMAGDLAYTRCSFIITVTPPGGTAVQRSGYTQTIYRKQLDGRWLLARDANLMT
jgi:uncharacterized protein (TIGR02246 family)